MTNVAGNKATIKEDVWKTIQKIPANARFTRKVIRSMMPNVNPHTVNNHIKNFKFDGKLRLVDMMGTEEVYVNNGANFESPKEKKPERGRLQKELRIKLDHLHKQLKSYEIDIKNLEKGRERALDQIKVLENALGVL